MPADPNPRSISKFDPSLRAYPLGGYTAEAPTPEPTAEDCPKRAAFIQAVLQRLRAPKGIQ